MGGACRLPNTRVLPPPPPLQVWATEVSRRCLSLLNSQDGGVLTVSTPLPGPSGTATFALLSCFGISVSRPPDGITPVRVR